MKIDKGIPIPPRQDTRKNLDILERMDVGDSIDLSEIGYEKARRRYISMSNAAKRHGMKVVMKDMRIWRIA